jgi:hypothetical protein
MKRLAICVVFTAILVVGGSAGNASAYASAEPTSTTTTPAETSSTITTTPPDVNVDDGPVKPGETVTISVENLDPGAPFWGLAR